MNHAVLLVACASLLTVPPAVAAPFAHTSDATEVRATSARLNGFATPNGLAAVAWFEWGERNEFSQSNAPVDVGNGALVIHVSTEISNLVAGATYQYRLVVSNAAGWRRGATRWLTTGNRLSAWGYNYAGQTVTPSWSNGWVAIAGGGAFSLALRPDGRAVAWGDNTSGQTNLPASFTNVVAVACGGSQSLALKGNRSVVAWGDYRYGQTNVPAGLSNVVALAAGWSHSLALRANGTVFAWGDDSSGQTNVPPGESNLVDIAAGESHCLALRNDGTVVAWGSNSGGQTNVPPGLTNVIAISGGRHYSLALRANGTVVAWGANFVGETSVPAGLTNVIAISTGGQHCLALRADGTVAAWGLSDAGLSTVPAGLSNVVALAAGSQHNVALGGNAPPQAQNQNVTGLPNSDTVIQFSGTDPNGDAPSFVITGLPAVGALYQFQSGGRGNAIANRGALVTDSAGRVVFVPATNAVGRSYSSFSFLANDRTVNSALATVTVSIVASLVGFTLPAAANGPNRGQLNGFVASQGLPATAWFDWGTTTNYGQTTGAVLADAGARVTHMRQQIGGLAEGQVIHFRLVASNASSVLRGADQQFVTTGKVVGWGDNSSGQSATPASLGAIVGLAGGWSHSLALRADGTVTAWGNNVHGQATVPPGLAGVVAIAGGGFHNLGLLTNGSVVAWGRNHLGQTNVPASASNVVAIAAGGQHGMALRADGSLVAWGDDTQGQRTIPASLTNIVGAAAGWYHNVALRSDGTVVAWGGNSYGQTNVPTGLTNVVWVGAGLYHCLALRGDGSLVAWGLNSAGQAAVPSTVTNTLAAACGGSYNLAMQANGELAGWGHNSFGQAVSPAGLSNVVNIAAGGSHALALLPNHPPITFDQIVAAYPNTDWLVSLAGSDADNDPLTLRIGALPAVGALYQVASGRRGAPIVSPGAIVSDSLGRIIFAPVANQIGDPYATFGFTASDGFADSAPATVAINIVLPSAPFLDLAASGRTANGEFQLAFVGATNATYRVWASTNLSDWEILGTATTEAPGQFLFRDASAASWPQRFYRATAP